MRYCRLAHRLLKKERALPFYLIFFVTSRCNARCSHCFYVKNVAGQREELSLEEIRKLTKSIGEIFQVNLTGGEPFLREDLPEIARAFYANCNTRSFGIPTNGYDPARISEGVRRMLSANKDVNLQVSVSIDHLAEEHDRIRGFPGLFNNAVRTAEALKAIRSPRLTVGVNLTLSTENEQDIERIYCFIRDRVQPDMVNPLAVRATPRDPRTRGFSPASYERLFLLWAKDMRAGRFKGIRGLGLSGLLAARDLLSKRAVLDILKGERCGLECLAGKIGGVLYEDGRVAACELIQDGLGNVRDAGYDFGKVWFSKEADEVRKKIKETNCCCTHECFLNLNILFNPSLFPRLMREWLLLSLRLPYRAR